MSIPSMPSVCSVWRLAAGTRTQIAAGVACRLVPVHWGGRPRFSGTPFTWTHWVDLPADQDVRGGCRLTQPLSATYTYSTSLADCIKISSAAPRCFYMAMWVERRYLDTPDEYTRAYVTWDDVNTLMSSPCP
jgi:hypothetical protein